MAKSLGSAVYEDDEDRSDGAEDPESSDGEEETEEVLQQLPRPNAVYNSVALHEKLEEIGWPEGLDWLQTLCIDYHVEEGDVDVNDDLAREMAFYTQALEGTREAFTKLVELGKPFLRPPDYYAEMVKSDSHMLKVKDALLSQQKQIEEAEERRKTRESKRFSKEVQAQKLKQRAQEKKQNIDSVKKWRKMRQDGGFKVGEDEFPFELDEVNADFRGSKKRRFSSNFEAPSEGLSSDHKKPFKKVTSNSESPSSKHKVRGDRAALRNPLSGRGSGRYQEKQGSRSPSTGHHPGSRGPAPWDRSGGKGSSQKTWNGKSSQKRQARNSKYGHGGRKGLKKSNTADSSAGFFKGNKKKRKF